MLSDEFSAFPTRRGKGWTRPVKIEERKGKENRLVKVWGEGGRSDLSYPVSLGCQ